MTLVSRPRGRDRFATAPRRRIAAAVTICAVVAAGAIAPISAQPSAPPADTPDPTSTQLDPLGGELSALEAARALLPETVRDVPVTGAGVERAEAEIQALETTIITNRTIRDRAIADLARLQGERQGHRSRITSQRRVRREAAQEAEQLRGELGELAVAAYMDAGDPAPGLDLDPESAVEAGRQEVLVEAVDTTLRERLAEAETEVVRAANEVESSRHSLIEVLGQIDTTTIERDNAIAELARAEPALPVAQEEFRDVFMTARVTGADFNVVALDAYRTAVSAIGGEDPNCRVPWTVLAGIARVESRHGTYGGARLLPDGTTNRRIIGIALDGSAGIMHIGDTDGGALDGDATFDRAVGPMQFIPTTWRMVRRDGDGNGRMDPHNLYDASLAAAAYLCRAGPRLDLAVPLNRAILTYNRSQSYVDAVLGHRRAYDRLDLPD